MPKAQIFYFSLNDETRRPEKLDWLRNNTLKSIDFERIMPDDKGNWLNQTDNDFETLLSIASKEVKNNKAGKEADKAIFKLFSLGVVTNRDEWVYDFNEKDLEKKVRFFFEFYEKEKERWQKSDKSIPINNFVDRTIKWTEELENHLKKSSKLSFDENKITTGLYRPYVKSFLYFDKIITHRVYQHDTIFGIEKRNENKVICFSISSRLPAFSVFASDKIPSLALYVEPTQCLPLYRYDENGNRIENITDWGLEQFQRHYATHGMTQSHAMSTEYTMSTMSTSTHAVSIIIDKESIFHYVYAVLHNPAYRTKYEQNLKRDFPRIPFYEDFERWAAWGKQLIELHISYEEKAPFGLEIVHRAWAGEPEKKVEQAPLFNEVKEIEPLYKKKLVPKTKLKADKLGGTIELDEKTYLKGIPAEAWEYKLGNRSALEWVLDQYKESKPSDPTIAEKFNTYRFADYKTQVIDLLQRVCAVSVETMKIIREMEQEN